MRVGIPTEIKNNEYRVAITPAGVAELTSRGHEVLVEAGAGDGSAITDNDFKSVGAQIISTADEVWSEADLLLKVKEPTATEYHRLRKGQTLFTYLHLAASRDCTEALLTSGTTAIAYETVQTADGRLPLLAPMSEVAGRLSAQVGAYHLMRSHGGRGVLMGGAPGVAPAETVVIGGGTAGHHAARIHEDPHHQRRRRPGENRRGIKAHSQPVSTCRVRRDGRNRPAFVLNYHIGCVRQRLIDATEDKRSCRHTQITDNPCLHRHGS